ncbi:MAG: VIT domain-containing protein [Planctomycetales bacterium]
MSSTYGRWLVICLLLGIKVASAQIVIPEPPGRPRPPVVANPPVWNNEYRVKEWNVHVRVQDQMARVQMTQVIHNPQSSPMEARILFPLPDQAVVQGLTLLVDGQELPGKLMTKEEARRIYEEIVRRRKDPALLEFVGQGSYQTNVFPIPAQGTRKVEIRYGQLLKKDQGLTDVAIPLAGARHGRHALEKLAIEVQLETTQPLKSIYSSTHSPDIKRTDDRHATCKLEMTQVENPQDFRLLFSTASGGVGLSLAGYRPEEGDEGYFLLLADPEFGSGANVPHVPKTMVYVLDRSGSMSGEKIKQAREALKFLVERLQPGDTFNIVAYDSEIESFKPELQKVDANTLQAAKGFIDGIHSGGSTNIDGALATALKMIPQAQGPTFVLFFTDGLPTVGEMNELKIAQHVKELNVHKARIFNFGVGYDVNSRLLDRLSREQRGQSIYVRPNENIESSVASLYARIGEPLLSDLKVALDFAEKPAAGMNAVSRTYPREISELFRGEQLVWVGRYKPSGAVTVNLTGRVGSEPKSYTLTAELPKKSTDEKWGFIAKLWATRRIGELIDQLDLNGKNQELIDELVQLSLKYGIMTPYTSFLAEEDVRLSDGRGNTMQAGERARMLNESSGASGFEQRRYKGELQSSKMAPAMGRTIREKSRKQHEPGGCRSVSGFVLCTSFGVERQGDSATGGTAELLSEAREMAGCGTDGGEYPQGDQSDAVLQGMVRPGGRSHGTYALPGRRRGGRETVQGVSRRSGNAVSVQSERRLRGSRSYNDRRKVMTRGGHDGTCIKPGTRAATAD